MRMKIFSIIILTLILTNYCSKNTTTNDKEDTIDEETTIENSIGIILKKNSSVRIQPYIYSSKITELKRGEKVKITDQSAEKSYIGKKHAYWYKILLSNGESGWTWGGNIKIFKEGQDSDLSSAEKEIEEKLKIKISEALVGKWWSLNKSGDFTNYTLIFWEDNKYLVKHKYGKEYKGNYTINTKKATINFPEKTSIGKEIHYLEKGKEIHIELRYKKYKVDFKKISSNPNDDKEETNDKKTKN